jgi:rubrerythrin
MAITSSEYNKRWRETHRDHIAAYNKSYRQENTEKVREIERKYKESHVEEIKKSSKEYRRKHPDRSRIRDKNNPESAHARFAIHHQIESGKIKKPKQCSACGNTGAIRGHHPDYSKPLEVVWLCHKCHCRLHRTLSLLKDAAKEGR